MKFLLILKKKGSYQDIRFIFNDYEECCIFMQNALYMADDEIELTISRMEGEENEAI